MSERAGLITQAAVQPSLTPARSGILQRACACGKHTPGGGECEECKQKRAGTLQRAAISPASAPEAPAIVHEVLRSSGQPLDPAARAVFEPRLSGDLSQRGPAAIMPQPSSGPLIIGPEDSPYEREARSAAERIDRPAPTGGRSAPESFLDHVRIHTDARAAESARAVNALAYTVGQDVVFGQGQYAPQTEPGRRLIAHELTHVVQQAGPLATGVIQRDGMGDMRLAQGVADQIIKIKGTPTFKALDAASTALTVDILTEIQKRPLADQMMYLVKLKLLFDTPVKPPATVSVETKTSTVTAAAAEKVRISKPVEAKNTQIEEKASKDPKRKNWVGIKGKFGGGTYYVDRDSPTNIVVRAKIHLTATGTGTVDDIKNIKSMEDAIEKAASSKGYLVDITFVDVADADTFEIKVDPSKWEVATNWSGGDPSGFAHELHHIFAFELDRYDYIAAHAANQSMEIPDRLIWFRKELDKPPNFNDPTSIMNTPGLHPNDSDVCTVAGLDMKTCMAARQAAAAPKKK